MYPTLKRWMRLPTPVTTSSMTVESWSTWKRQIDLQRADRHPATRARTMCGSCGGCAEELDGDDAGETKDGRSRTPDARPAEHARPCAWAGRSASAAVDQEAKQRKRDGEPDPRCAQRRPPCGCRIISPGAG